eukprot:s1234_g1.t1
MLIRVGEAQVPGPTSAEWILGTCNPSGLQGKYHVLNSVKADVLAISESHLTVAAKRSLKISLRSMRSQYRHVLTGAPVAQRSQASEAGQWSGVAFASALPCRSVATDWPPDLYDTGRLQFAAFHTPASWTFGAVVYGYPAGKTHPNALARTEAILDFALDRLLLLPGPKFLTGDFNFDPADLAITQRLQSLGWAEIQDLHLARTGCPVQLTCKGATRKDLLWISPELVIAFRSAHVCDQTFADHAVLTARFDSGLCQLDRFTWPCPKEVPWKRVPVLDQAVSFAAPLDPTAQYAELWRIKEAQAQDALSHAWMASMGGRGQQTQPKKQRGRHAPVRQGRSSDVAPAFFGFSAQHAKQFRQLRRLQNYCRWIDNVSLRPASGLSDNLHGIGLWNSILRASGFVPSFSVWWLSRSYVSPLDPPAMPQFCPPSAVAHQIFDAVFAEVRALECRLTAARTAHRVHQHQRDRHLIFREVARPPAEPVESLIHSVRAQVAEVDLHETAVVLDCAAPVRDDIPLWIAGRSCEVIHADHDKVWVSALDHVEVGQTVVQTQYVGDLQALFDAFHTQWKRRWCRHDGLPFSRWDALLGFARQVLQPVPVPHLCLDVDLLRAEFHRKKKRSATGLDGVSRGDWIAADWATLTSLLNAYCRAESDGSWPQQLLAGKVHSLAKTESAASVGDYRPITVFGLGYRAWSSLHSRHLLQWAEHWVDDGVYGNRQGRQASDLWHHVMLEIERAYTQSTPLCGLSADLEKCFNCIPRFPALCLAVLVGTPAEVTTAWAGALAQMCRHFKIRESFSSGFETSTGLAEGCGLSVYGMLLVDHLFALWMRVQAPAIRTLSYVDDWQTLTWNPDLAARQLDLLDQYATMLDLTVDRRKTFGWATDAATRRILRDHGIQVLHHARELGGHLGVSRQHTNHTLKQRLEALADFWSKLKGSRARYPAKVYMLRAVAWPRGLHAISSAPLGDTVWTDLRRKAVQALGLQKPGISSHVLLGLVEALVDPQFVGLLWTCRAVRTQCPVEFWTSAVAPVSFGELDLPPNSLASIVSGRVRQAGLPVARDGSVCDRFGSFHLHTLNYAEVELRLFWAWTQVVASRVSHRAEFAGLWQVDVARTRKALTSLPLDDQAMYRHQLAGGLFTESYKAKWTDQSDACPWCGQVDTLMHRFWQCPQHRDLRESLAPVATSVCDTLPPAMALRGWALLPSTWFEWTCRLASLSLDLPQPAFVLESGIWNDVFTDGSCLCQSDPLLRVASWACVGAPGFGATWNFRGARVLGSSYLPGLCQTAFRAELYAVAFALHCAACARAPIRLWSDCLGVLNRCHLLIWGKVKVKLNRSNSDLWLWIQHSVDILGKDRVQLRKVPAHRALHSARSRWEAWVIFHNAVVDKFARAANQLRPTGFWDLWERHVQATHAAEVLCNQVRDLHLAVGRRNVRGSLESEEISAAPPRATRDFEKQFDLGHWQGSLPDGLSRLYGDGHVRRVTAWFWHRLDRTPDAEVVWVSFVQLYIDYQLTWGNPGPMRIQGQWVDVANRPYLDAERFSFKQRVRWFRQLIKGFLQKAQITASMVQCRPLSTSIQTYVPSVALPWRKQALYEVAHWLGANLKSPCVRDASVLQRLPLALRSGRWQMLAVRIEQNAAKCWNEEGALVVECCGTRQISKQSEFASRFRVHAMGITVISPGEIPCQSYAQNPFTSLIEDSEPLEPETRIQALDEMLLSTGNSLRSSDADAVPCFLGAYRGGDQHSHGSQRRATLQNSTGSSRDQCEMELLIDGVLKVLDDDGDHDFDILTGKVIGVGLAPDEDEQKTNRIMESVFSLLAALSAEAKSFNYMAWLQAMGESDMEVTELVEEFINQKQEIRKLLWISNIEAEEFLTSRLLTAAMTFARWFDKMRKAADEFEEFLLKLLADMLGQYQEEGCSFVSFIPWRLVGHYGYYKAKQAFQQQAEERKRWAQRLQETKEACKREAHESHGKRLEAQLEMRREREAEKEEEPPPVSGLPISDRSRKSRLQTSPLTSPLKSPSATPAAAMTATPSVNARRFSWSSKRSTHMEEQIMTLLGHARQHLDDLQILAQEQKIREQKAYELLLRMLMKSRVLERRKLRKATTQNISQRVNSLMPGRFVVMHRTKSWSELEEFSHVTSSILQQQAVCKELNDLTVYVELKDIWTGVEGKYLMKKKPKPKKQVLKSLQTQEAKMEDWTGQAEAKSKLGQAVRNLWGKARESAAAGSAVSAILGIQRAKEAEAAAAHEAQLKAEAEAHAAQQAAEAAAAAWEQAEDDDIEDLYNFPPHFSLVDVQLLLSDAAVTRTEKLRELRQEISKVVQQIGAQYGREAWDYNAQTLQAHSNYNPWAKLESGRFFLSRQDAAKLQDLMRMMRGIKSQLAVETANRSHFDDEARLQQSMDWFKGNLQDTTDFP